MSENKWRFFLCKSPRKRIQDMDLRITPHPKKKKTNKQLIGFFFLKEKINKRR